ncbi:MAG: hypothetical protein FD177_1372 [Desulfovibrionaceae bacterium]|nr:MAG: hypothetical protein FD177_1372 [Desulfovibrionaceae bacterium]
MKKRLLALVSLMLIVVCASSGYALTIDLPVTSGKWYGTYIDSAFNPVDLTQKWSASQTLGAGTYELKLDITTRGVWSSVPATDSFEFFAAGSTLKEGGKKYGGSYAEYIVNDGSGNKGYVFTYTLPAITAASGIYAFSAFSVGESYGGPSPAEWKMNSASVSKTPIPAAFLLLGSGLVGLFGVKRVRRGSAAA